ncbi:aquaporin [Egicoccus sp. AB-alg2]|uniref:aquaporin n=1 Tax=Egicoccus sp. AB-alg2 TaxID=3242693 RepID=UPI00359D8FAE
MTPTEPQRVVAEFLGTALLLMAVVGSGIVTSDGGSASAQLFQHAVAVGAALVALILAFGPVSGAHFNPAVTAADWWFGGIPTGRALRYLGAQVGGATAGTLATNAMFGVDLVTLSTNARDGFGPIAGEVVATGGLLLVIFALVHTGRLGAVPGAVGAWIGAAIFFTASASFANPAVTLARALTDSYTGIAPGSVPGFLLGQALGTLAGVALVAWLYRPSRRQAEVVVQPHGDGAARNEAA